MVLQCPLLNAFPAIGFCLFQEAYVLCVGVSGDLLTDSERSNKGLSGSSWLRRLAQSSGNALINSSGIDSCFLEGSRGLGVA